MSNETTNPVRMFPALSLMEKSLPPLRYGREPYWRAPITPPSHDAYVPSWAWYNPNVPEGLVTRTLDANGMYLGALGAVDIAHSHLSHVGPYDVLPGPREVDPGYYRITIPYWAFGGTCVSPLGDSARLQTETDLWIAAPTLVLLLELTADGHLGSFEILDSWSARTKTHFRSWVGRLKSVRTEILDQADAMQTDADRQAIADRYRAFKEGYGSALSMMLSGGKCKTRRPDWTHTVYAQAAAAQWRKAWRYTYTGCPLVSLGGVDELTVVDADLPEVLARPKPPFRLDESGRQLGAFKTKTTQTQTRTAARAPQAPDDVTTSLLTDLDDLI